jgi:hypothetical protein
MTGEEDRALVAARGGAADVLAAGEEVVAAAVIAVIGVLAAVSIGVMGDAKEGPDSREAFTSEACRLGRGFLRTGDALPGGW